MPVGITEEEYQRIIQAHLAVMHYEDPWTLNSAFCAADRHVDAAFMDYLDGLVTTAPQSELDEYNDDERRQAPYVPITKRLTHVTCPTCLSQLPDLFVCLASAASCNHKWQEETSAYHQKFKRCSACGFISATKESQRTSLLGLESHDVITPGESQTIEVIAQQPCRPSRLIVNPSISERFTIDRWRIGAREQFQDGSGSIPAQLFASQQDIAFDVAAAGMTIAVTVTNISADAARFLGAIACDVLTSETTEPSR